MAQFVHLVTHSHLTAFSLISTWKHNKCFFCYGRISLSFSFFQEHMELVGDTLRTRSLPSILTASPIPSLVRNYTYLSQLWRQGGKVCTHTLKTTKQPRNHPVGSFITLTKETLSHRFKVNILIAREVCSHLIRYIDLHLSPKLGGQIRPTAFHNNFFKSQIRRVVSLNG